MYHTHIDRTAFRQSPNSYSFKSNDHLRGSWNEFPDIFRMDTFIDSTRMKL